MTVPTPRDELVEKVARAIARSLDGFQYPDDAEKNWRDCLPEAKAALAVVAEELREPTQLMVCQAQESFGMRPSYSAMKKALKAAIAASPLGDKP